MWDNEDEVLDSSKLKDLRQLFKLDGYVVFKHLSAAEQFERYLQATTKAETLITHEGTEAEPQYVVDWADVNDWTDDAERFNPREWQDHLNDNYPE